MDNIKKLIRDTPSDELKSNVHICVEHICAIFLGDFQGFNSKEGAKIISHMTQEFSYDMNETDMLYKEMFETYLKKKGGAKDFWNSIHTHMKTVRTPVKGGSPVAIALLNCIESIEISSTKFPMHLTILFEALVTGQWKLFSLTAAELMSPSGVTLNILGNYFANSICSESHNEKEKEKEKEKTVLRWCKRELGDGPYSNSMSTRP